MVPVLAAGDPPQRPHYVGPEFWLQTAPLLWGVDAVEREG
jgi:hypothetical protein